MKPSTYQPLSEQTLTSTGTADVQTANIPKNTSGVYITVETNNARMALSQAGDPTVTGLIVQKDQMPWYLPVGDGAKIQFVSVSATSVIRLSYLR